MSSYTFILETLVESDLAKAELSASQKASVSSALSALAFEGQAKGARLFEAKDLPAALQGPASAGQLALVSVAGSRVKLFHASFQDFLAAQHLWRLLEKGEAFPAWAAKEGRGNVFAVETARFLGALAVGQGILSPDRINSLQAGLAAVLRNVSSVGDEEATRGLLAMIPDRSALIQAQGPGETTALELAAIGGHVNTARALLELAPDRRALFVARGELQATPLHIAAGNGHAKVARTLLARSPDPRALLEAKDSKGRTALEWALAGRHFAVLSVLRETDGMFCVRIPSHVQVSYIEVYADGRGGAALEGGRAALQ